MKLFRTPLRANEPVYALGNIDQGLVTSGDRKGEALPKLQSVLPKILEDGRLCWEMLDNDENHKLAALFLPQTENPPFTYSIEFGVKESVVDAVNEIEESEEVEQVEVKPRGRPVKK